MALSPLDIRNKEFTVKMRGFSQEEVDDFLDQVMTDYENVLREKRELEKALKHSEEKLTYFNELKDALNQSIIVAQDTADKLKDSASKESSIIVSTAEKDAKEILAQANAEADRIISEATAKVKQMVKDATTKTQQLAVETDDLKKKTRVFHRNLLMLLESQLDIVKSEEWDELLRPFASYVNEEHQLVKEILDQNTEQTSSTSEVEEEEKETKVEEKTPEISTTQVVFPSEETFPTSEPEHE